MLLGLKPTFNQFSKIDWVNFPPNEAETIPASPDVRKQNLTTFGKIVATRSRAETYVVRHEHLYLQPIATSRLASANSCAAEWTLAGSTAIGQQ